MLMVAMMLTMTMLIAAIMAMVFHITMMIIFYDNYSCGHAVDSDNGNVDSTDHPTMMMMMAMAHVLLIVWMHTW